MKAFDIFMMAPIGLLLVFSLGAIVIGIKYMIEDSK